MAKREETLVKNTLVFAIGNLGSKLVQIILVPFYARILTSEQYGTTDILQAVVSLLIPICSLAIYESVFRYAMDNEYDKSAVLSTGVSVTLAGTAVMCVAGMIMGNWFPPQYVWLVIANTAVNAIWTLVSQYTKAIGHTVLFAVDNILMTTLVLVLNIVFLSVFRMGIAGYMLGYIVANLLSGLFLIVCLKSDFRLEFKKVKKPLLKEMLLFSFPLILNGICWWLSSFTSRIMITATLGAAANGQYAAASKIPQLLSVVVTIFYQAWQVSANEEFKSKDAVPFYSQTYEQNSAFTFLIGSFLILACRPLNTVFLGENYTDAWRLMPPLVMMTVFFSFSQFLISIYSANKKTNMAFVTNLFCVAVNIGLNWLMLPIWGAMGAAIATAIAYFLLWIVRIVDTRKIIPIEYRTGRIVISTLILLVQSVLVCLDLDTVFTYGICTVCSVGLLVMYKDTVIGLVRLFVQMLRRVVGKRGPSH